jgi:hypothetical protein
VRKEYSTRYSLKLTPSIKLKKRKSTIQGTAWKWPPALNYRRGKGHENDFWALSNTVSSNDYGLESQRTIRYRPKKMTFREYDKKMLNFFPGLKYWRTVLENKNEWDRQKPTSIGGNITLWIIIQKMKWRN